MNSETRTCQNCKSNFTVEPDDFVFYEKIQVPPPTFCPECRRVRRMVWRNVRSLYRRVCGLCGKSLISMYSDDGCAVYCTECWNGDAWDQYAYGQEIDWNVPFLVQWHKIFTTVPRHYNYRSGTIVNSDYSNYNVNNKNAYLSFSIVDDEDVQYCENADRSKDSFDCLGINGVSNCSWNVDVEGNFNCQYALQSKSSMDSHFIFDCDNCKNCVLSSNLRNQSYYFRNRKVSREEYQRLLSELKLSTISGMANARREFSEIMRRAKHRYANVFSSQNVTGDFISNSRNVRDSFDVWKGENISHSNRITNQVKDCYDCYGILTGELEYETLAGSVQSYNIRFASICLTCKNMQYSALCRGCSDCFGCVGLRDARYCILNRQYSKEEYEALVPKLIQHMDNTPYVDSKGRVYAYGEFFPFDMSPYGYNESSANEYFSLTEEECAARGYNWRTREKRDYAVTMKAGAVPEDSQAVEEGILKEVIECTHKGKCDYQCSLAFRITPEELSFLKRKGLALPILCPNCRHYERVQMRNPLKLWKRRCMCQSQIAGSEAQNICKNTAKHVHGDSPCPNEFETSYSPERPETIYCETCYQAEVV